jgi:hypothetical protein
MKTNEFSSARLQVQVEVYVIGVLQTNRKRLWFCKRHSITEFT